MIYEIQLDNNNLEIEDVLKSSHETDAGFDYIMQEDTVLKPGENTINLHFKCELPQNVAAFVMYRSSWMAGVLDTKPAPIDPYYSGNWNWKVRNTTDKDIVIKKGERVFQIVFLPFIKPILVKPENFPKRRDVGGLGSTGK